MNASSFARTPIRIGLPGVLVAVLIGTTVPVRPASAPTYRVFPSGVIAMPKGLRGLPPRRIGFPAVLVAVLIGVTVPEPAT